MLCLIIANSIACFDANVLFTLLPLYCERYNVTEELKATNQMEWVRRMNNIINAIEEIILNEIVYR